MIFKHLAKVNYLAVDNHRAVDVRSHQGSTESIKVPVQGIGRIANRNTNMVQARELFFDSGNHFSQTHDFLRLNFALFFGDVDYLEFSTVIFGLLFQHTMEFSLIFFDRLTLKKKVFFRIDPPLQ